MNPLALGVLIAFASQAPSAVGSGSFYLERSADQFGMRSHGIVEMVGPNRTKLYPLPQSTAQDYIRLRPSDFRLNPFKPEEYERQEVIGPSQTDGGRIWFGKNFYDGEGMRGVGAFGYFDTATRKYTLFSPNEVAPYEVSAILVQPEVVWIALDHFGEDVATGPGGLVRWERSTHAVQSFALEFAVSKLQVQGDALRLTTHGGYAFLRDGEIRRYLDCGNPIQKFPPPPSQY